MPDKTHVAISQHPVEPILDFFGYGKRAISHDALRLFVNIAGILAAHHIDQETATQIAQSFEDKNGKLDDPFLRLQRFHKFMDTIHQSRPQRNAFLDHVKNLGLLSKNELETYGKETGNWSHFLKRSAKDNEEASADKTNEMGSKTEVQPDVH